ncbi:MAG: sodium/hydrogen exchanger [uncultured Chthoniobacterales bacterium]|uniref:Sodium/hydrogen exchanger n=1 Tax=uncultured Chthoniobacterales bacterium TaxID=1836801 RepID=A0A6J4IRK3_9BACT|nr:MAG: sodium/hydrogen exchanger [uncultured Chthoniobacterales bacterium]
MNTEVWYLIIGLLLVGVAVSGTMLKRLPLTPTMVYLGLGAALGPVGLGLFEIDPLRRATLLEHAAEIAVIVSLFTTGLKLRVPLRDKLWWIPARLAFVSMTITVGLVALVGVYGLGLPWGAAVLLGAVLAPTDPVLASDVQLESAADTDRLRFSITGEAGLNDGTAFPFVMLGLGLMGLHEIGEWGWRWLAVDVVWAIAGGLAIGAAGGFAVGKLVVYLRREHKESIGADEFLALGLIAFVYGAALLTHTYGFLAVFAAGLALRSLERRHTADTPVEEMIETVTTGKKHEVAADPQKAPAHMAEALLGFNEQMERVLEVGLVLLVGAMLTPQFVAWRDLWFVPVLFLVVRPMAVLLGAPGRHIGKVQRGLICWFGIRGIGSIYYLMYAVGHGLPPEIAARLVSLTLCVIAASVVVHGISAAPLMKWYHARRRVKAG